MPAFLVRSNRHEPDRKSTYNKIPLTWPSGKGNTAGMENPESVVAGAFG